MFCERSGQVSKSGFGVPFVLGKDLADNVGPLETNGKLSARADVIRTGEERRIRLQHGSRGEVESPLATWTVLADILYEFSRAMNRFPMNSGFVGDDCAGLDVRKSRERSFEQVHCGRII